MGQIGRFVDHCCEYHPHLMRAVLERPLSPLSSFIDFDRATNQLCGCLIGTAALAAGFTPYVERDINGLIDCASDEGEDGEASYEFLAHSVGYSALRLKRVGIAVSEVAERLVASRGLDSETADARVIHLLRQRIARQLAIRESALCVCGVLPGEPVERITGNVMAVVGGTP